MDLDMRIVRRDGEIRVLHCRAAARRSARTGRGRLDGTCVDVTDRRRAERRLAEAQRFAQLGSWDWDVGRDEITWSREMYRIFGEDPEHFVPTSERAHRADRRGGPRAAQRADHGARASAAATSTRSPASGAPTGRSATSASAARWCRRPAPGEGHLHGICQDLTDVRRAEERPRRGGRALPLGVRARPDRDGPGGARRALHARQRGDGRVPRPPRRRRCSTARVGDVTHPDDMPATSEALRADGGGRAGASGTPRSATCGRAARSAGARCGRCSCATPTASTQHCLALVRDVTDQRLAERRRSALHGVSRIMAGGAPLSEALPALVETDRARARLGARRAVAASTRTASCAARPPGRPAARRRSRRRCPPSRRRPARASSSRS